MLYIHRWRVRLVFVVMLTGAAGWLAAADSPSEKKSKDGIAALIKKLQSPDYDVRLKAAGELAALGTRAEPAIPALVVALEDATSHGPMESSVHSYAASALRNIGSPAVPALMAAAKKSVAALNMLGNMGSDAQEAIPLLQTMLKREEISLRAAIALRSIDPDGNWIVPAIVPGTGLPIDTLLRQLVHKNPWKRWEAAERARWFRSDARKTVLLADLLRDKNSFVRHTAATELAQMEQEAIPAAAALLRASRDEIAPIRADAISILPKIAPRDPAVVAALIDRLADSDLSIRREAAYGLGKMGAAAVPAVPRLIEALSRLETADTAAGALGEIGPEAWKAALPILLRALNDKEDRSKLREIALQEIGGFGAGARAAIPSLVEAITDNRDDIKNKAIESLVRLGSLSVPALTQMLKDTLPEVRALAAQMLGRIGTAGKSAVPALEKAGKDSSTLVRVEAAMALWQIDGRTAEIVPVLIESVTTHNSDIPRRVKEALVAMGPAAKSGVPALIAQLKEPEKYNRVLLFDLLRSLGPMVKPAVLALLQILKDKEDDSHAEAAWLLGRLGGDAPEVVSALIAALDEDKPEIRWTAAAALGEIGSPARSAAPALLRRLRDRDRIVRASAALAIGRLGETARPGVPSLARLLREEDTLIRWSAAIALETLGSTARAAVPDLARLVSDRGGKLFDNDADLLPVLERRLWLRSTDDDQDFLNYMDEIPSEAYNKGSLSERAIQILAAIGPDARAAVPTLLTALRDDPRVTVRLAAAAALHKIDPAALEKAEPTPKEMETLWKDLARDNAVTAYRTLWTMILAPRPTLAWLRDHMRPIESVKAERIAQLIRDLDDDRFAVRQKAAAELEALAEVAEPALRATLKERPTLEVRRRIEQLLQHLEESTPPPEQVRLLRAVAVLDKIGNKESRALLRTLAQGCPSAGVTEAAKAALQRGAR